MYVRRRVGRLLRRLPHIITWMLQLLGWLTLSWGLRLGSGTVRDNSHMYFPSVGSLGHEMGDHLPVSEHSGGYTVVFLGGS